MEESKEPIKRDLKSRVENFWYHYKWHSIVAAFVVIAVLVCSLQMCHKEKYDAYVLYAGGYSVSRAETQDVAEYVKFISSFKRVTPDTDENGTVNPCFLDLYIPNGDKLDNSQNASALIKEDSSRLQYELISGSEYYLCFLSVENYNKYKIWDEVRIFDSLSGFVPAGTEVAYYDDCAIYLSSLEFGSLEGISSLPDDTVLCLRKISAVGAVIDKKINERNREDAEIILKNILSFKK